MTDQDIHEAEAVVGHYALRWGPMFLTAIGGALIATLGIRVVGPRQEQEHVKQQVQALNTKLDSVLRGQARMDSTAFLGQTRVLNMIAGTILVACQTHPKESYLAGLPCVGDSERGPRLVPQLPPINGGRY